MIPASTAVLDSIFSWSHFSGRRRHRPSLSPRPPVVMVVFSARSAIDDGSEPGGSPG